MFNSQFETHMFPKQFSRRQVLAGAATIALTAAIRRGLQVVGAQDGSPVPAAPIGLQADGTWVFTDDRGVTITTEGIPQTIVAETTAAAALWDLGVKVAGVVGPTVVADGSNDFQAGSIDFTKVAALGDFGEYDMEKLVSLAPDLVIDMSLYGDTFWYLQSVRETVEKIAPMLGISMQTNPIIESIERFEQLAVALGANLETPEIAQARTAFELAETDFKAAVGEKPGLTVVVTSPGTDNVYIGSPDWMTDLAYFRELGLDILTHTTEDFFALIAWEEIATYPADIILVDARGDGMNAEFLKTNDVWNSLPAVKAGQVGKWYAGAPYSRLRLTSIMVELTELIRKSNADIV